MHCQRNSANTPEMFSRVGLAVMAFGGIGALFVMTEHAPHVSGLLAYALLTALPLIHLFTRSGD